MQICKAALLFHAFFATSGTESADPHPLWRAATMLGLRDPVSPYPDDFPETTPGYADRLTVLAAAQGRGLGVHQMLAFHQHDVLGVTVVLAPAAADGWIGLDQTWRQSIDGVPMPGLIGTVTEYIGLLPAPGPLAFIRRNRAADAPAAIGQRLRQQVPASAGNWPNWWCRGGPGALLWELPATDPTAGTRRRLLVLGREADEDAIDRWLWSDETPGLVPFTRYLMHAAKLRHQSVLLAGSLQRLREVSSATEAACDQLRGYLDDETTSIDRLVTADRVVSRVHTERTGLIAALADVRLMARTVEAAQFNMAAAAGAGAVDAHSGPFSSDRQIAQWALEQLRSEEVYLTATQQRAKELARVTATVVARDLSDRQERLTLVQTGIIGSLLMTLAGVQALHYVVPLPGPLLAPLLVTLAVLALVLPIAVSSWSRASVPRRSWLLFNIALLALLGAAGGWLIASAISLSLSGQAAGPGWILSGILLGAMLATCSGLLKLRRSRAPD